LSLRMSVSAEVLPMTANNIHAVCKICKIKAD
jgi:hypothetical protein